ncbi:MAG: phosphate signaling complex protein PhoU [Elusimicrobia bacterium]|nr:phosphate signaling complex protein PhoU [Candidatus Liberimonas magnetica]
MLEEKLISLKKELVEYASLVESMVEKSSKGLLNKEKSLLKEVIEKDEPKANNYEIEMDELCTNIIAQYQPKARSLRTVLMVLKMSNDLERMGDHAVNIVESALFLIERPWVKPMIDIPKMAETTISMLRDSINSFINEDAVLARNVCQRDNIVDDLKDKIVIELSAVMSSDTTAIERSLHLLRISGNLERIADLSTNICEEVMFMVEGKVIKHHNDETKDHHQ